jgi:hypothetical protein
MKSVSSPDIGADRTPSSVLAVREFKDKLIQSGGSLKAADSMLGGVKIPDIHMGSSLPAESDDADAQIERQDYMHDEAMEDSTMALGPAPVKSEQKMNFNNSLEALSEYLGKQPSREDVKIIGDFGRLAFKAVNVSINEYGVAFIVRKDAFQFEPNLNTSLKVLYKEVEYNVVYAGGFFTFDKMPFTFVSFIRVDE